MKIKQSGLIKPGRIRKYLAIGLLTGGIAAFAADVSAQGPMYISKDHHPAINIGFSPHMFSGIDQENIVSAIKIWADSSLGERGVQLGSKPRIYNTNKEMMTELQKGNVDFLAMLAVDYLSLENEVGLSNFHFSMRNGSIAEEYVLLIHRTSGISTLADLRGKSILIQTGFRENLAPLWLDALLMQEGFAAAGAYFNKIEFKENLLKVVLPVFFGKVDACLVTRNNINSMVEMNPQISSRLRILTSSEELVPSLFCVRSDYSSMLKNEFLSALRSLNHAPQGQQVLDLFQSEQLVSGHANDLTNTRMFLDQYMKLKAERSVP